MCAKLVGREYEFFFRPLVAWITLLTVECIDDDPSLYLDRRLVVLSIEEQSAAKPANRDPSRLPEHGIRPERGHLHDRSWTVVFLPGPTGLQIQWRATGDQESQHEPGGPRSSIVSSDIHLCFGRFVSGEINGG